MSVSVVKPSSGPQDATNLELSFYADFLPCLKSERQAREFLHVLQQNDQITSVSVTIEKNESGIPNSFRPNWRPLLEAVSSMPNLRRISIASSFDITGRQAMTLADLTATLRAAVNLQDFKLDSVGILVSDALEFLDLGEVIRGLGELRHVHFENLYFIRQTLPDSWMQCTQMAHAFAQLPSLRTFFMAAATRYYSRPVLTLDALHGLWSHGSLANLTLENMNLWGVGNAHLCVSCLARNTVLTHLSLKSCVFAGDTSLLEGLKQNNVLQHLNLATSMLNLEAEALTPALARNTSLRSLGLSGARFGFDEAAHLRHLSRTIVALRNHPTIASLDLRGFYDGTQDAVDGATTELQPWARAVYQLITELLEENRTIYEVHLDVPKFECLWQLFGEVQLLAGLNRSGYWKLSPSDSNPAAYTDALAMVSDHIGVLFSILRSHPALCHHGTRTGRMD